MKRIILLLFIHLAAMIGGMAWAQTGLPIDALFHGNYKDAPSSTEIVVTGKRAASMGLTVYRSLTINAGCNAADQVRRVVIRQGTQAASREVEYRQGNLYYGYYALPAYMPDGKGKRLNRYLFSSTSRSMPGANLTR